ncbi:DNA-processing protein DprA [soil metagenome]
MAERLYTLGFSLFPGIGPKRLGQLVSHFGSAENAWNAQYSDFEQIGKPALTDKFFAFKKTFNIDEYLQKLEEKNVWFVTTDDSLYPSLLNKSHDPPLVLFGKGEKSVLAAKRTIGIVGTRKITSYGRQVTESITADLVASRFCIVSGLAMGVDALAHGTALQHNAATIAVLGSGVDLCTPMENYGLYQKIIEKGSCVISEFPLSQTPTVGSFPSRNRIIAGLSQGIVVTEGAFDSGALITAKDAFTDGRPVFAIPGPITSSLSRGPNELLKKGGMLVTSGDDILSKLGMKLSKRIGSANKIEGDSDEEQKVIDVLAHEELSFDELKQKCVFDTARLNTVLSLMEMKGFVTVSENGNYFLNE